MQIARRERVSKLMLGKLVHRDALGVVCLTRKVFCLAAAAAIAACKAADKDES